MRPLLVLLLVVAAVGALIFAVFTMDSGGTTPGIAPEPVGQTTDSTPRTETKLDQVKDNPERMNAPASQGGNRTASATPDTFDNAFTGKVQNLMGEAVEGAEVILTTVGADAMFFLNDPVDRSKDLRARTDAEGAYRFRGVQPRERYTIIVEHPKFARYEGGTVPIKEFGPHEEPPIVLKPGATLSGYVRDEGGGTIPDAALFLENIAYQGFDDAAPDRMKTTTDAQGYYTFQNVPRGQRVLTVTAKGFGTITIPGLNFDREETQTRDVTLKVSEMLSGRVVSGGGQGVANARVLAVAISSQQQSARGETRTNETGDFVFESLIPGEYNLIATADGFRMTSGPKRVSTGTNTSIIEMMREAAVTGRCVDAATGDPIPNFTCRLRFWYGAQQPSQLANEKSYPQSNPNGEFVIAGVAQGDYVVEASAPGYAPGFSSNFSVPAGGKDVGNITVGLSKGGSLSGRVVDGEGKPVARARVTTHDNEWTDDEFTRVLGFSYPTNATSAEARTDDQGRFSIQNLTPETYQINVRAAGFTLLVKKDVRVGGESPTDAGELKLARGGSLKGTFFDASGKPLSGGMVSLRLAEGDYPASYATKSGTDGRFAFTNVTPGRYYLTGTRAGGGEPNPFQPIFDEKNSQQNVVVAEGQTTTQDLHLQE